LLLKALSIGANLDYMTTEGSGQSALQKVAIFTHYVEELNATFRHFSLAPFDY
jgi:hypothetical protein